MRVVTASRASAVLYNWLHSSGITGGRVLMPANICETVPASYAKAGIACVFCDIEYGTWYPDRAQILHMLAADSTIRVLHYNHTYGVRTAEETAFLQQVRQRFPDRILVEDCCLCEPVLTAPADSCVDMQLFSTGHTKVVNIGGGGYAFLSPQWPYHSVPAPYDPEAEVRFDRHVKACHARPQPVDWSVMEGDWIDTAIREAPDAYLARVRAAYDRAMAHKQALNRGYARLRGGLAAPYQNWRYHILVENQQACLQLLTSHGLYASKHYKSLANGYFTAQQTPCCDWLEAHVINLFNDFCYTEQQAEQTIELLQSAAIPAEEKKPWKP